MDLSQMWLDKIRTKSVCLKHIGKSLRVYKKGKEDAPKFWDNVNDKTNHWPARVQEVARGYLSVDLSRTYGVVDQLPDISLMTGHYVYIVFMGRL